jgi:hypothetical protein
VCARVRVRDTPITPGVEVLGRELPVFVEEKEKLVRACACARARVCVCVSACVTHTCHRRQVSLEAFGVQAPLSASASEDERVLVRCVRVVLISPHAVVLLCACDHVRVCIRPYTAPMASRA